MPDWTQTRLSNTAVQAGGAATYLFSQGQQLRYGGGPALYRLVNRRTDPNGAAFQPMGGACYAISAFWVIFHATQGTNNAFTKDRSLWDYLFDQGGLNQGAAANIVVEHRQSTGRQLAYFDGQLRKFGIIPRKNIVSGERLAGSSNFGGVADRSFRGYLICNSFLSQGEGYRIVVLNRKGGGHAVAGWVGQDVSFMDPNFGEFWFPNHRSFQNWFPTFWQISNYPYVSSVVRTYAPQA